MLRKEKALLQIPGGGGGNHQERGEGTAATGFQITSKLSNIPHSVKKEEGGLVFAGLGGKWGGSKKKVLRVHTWEKRKTAEKSYLNSIKRSISITHLTGGER